MLSDLAAGGISVVVPVYRGGPTLPELVERVAAVLTALGGPWEVILVNDASPDDSWSVIEALCTPGAPVVGIDLMRNAGQHAALLAGIRAARHGIVVTMDDDLQHPPEEIPTLLAHLADGTFDVVYGSPRAQQHGLGRDLASSVTKIALREVMSAEAARHVGAFRAFRTKVRDAFARYDSPFVSIDVLLSWGTTRIGHIEVDHRPRTVGTSGYTLPKLVVHALNMATGYSVRPLQLASWIGFLFTAVGATVLAYVLAVYAVNGGDVPGFTFLAGAIALFSGIQLFTLGVIGEYLARVHVRTMDRPSFVVREVLRTDEPGPVPPPAA